MTGKVAPYDLAGDIIEVQKKLFEEQQQQQYFATEEVSSAIRVSQDQITEVDEGGDLS